MRRTAFTPDRRPPGRPPVRVLVADDDEVFAELLSLWLASDPRFELVGRAGEGRAAVELATRLRPDVVLMDVEMPVLDGLEATRIIRRRSPGTRVVIVSARSAAEDVARGVEAGACRFVAKGRATDEALAEAILAAVSTPIPFPLERRIVAA